MKRSSGHKSLETLTWHSGPYQHHEGLRRAQTAVDYNPDYDQLMCFGELVHIVKAGEVVRHS
jgi:hypothetical protein